MAGKLGGSFKRTVTTAQSPVSQIKTSPAETFRNYFSMKRKVALRAHHLTLGCPEFFYTCDAQEGSF